MEVRELMKRPAVSCAPETTLAEAARRMRSASVGSILVVSDLGIVGIATDRDIVVRGLAVGLGAEDPIEMVMTRDVQYVYSDVDVIAAARKMATHGCRRLPVLDPDNGIQGFIALDDLVMLFAHQIGSLAETVRREVAASATA